jgi:hypothetical protein
MPTDGPHSCNRYAQRWVVAFARCRIAKNLKSIAKNLSDKAAPSSILKFEKLGLARAIRKIGS